MPARMIPNLPVMTCMPFSEIEEKRPVLLVTSPPAWKAVREKLRRLPVLAQLEPVEATLAAWDRLLLSVRGSPARVVYAVGGGLSADAAKYIAGQFGLPLVMLPTAISVDAFLTASSGIRRDGCVQYIPTKVPDQLVLDLEIIAAAPENIRAAGITDVLSIATGSWDWFFAHEKEQNPPGMEFLPWASGIARSILQAALDCAEAAGRGDLQGLKCLYDCLALEVQLCNQLGHARPEEGSEHYFAYCAEQFTGPGWPHGDLVGPGILHILQRQEQDPIPFKNAMKLCGIQLERIPLETVRQTMKNLPEYCRKHALPFGIAHIPEERR